MFRRLKLFIDARPLHEHLIYALAVGFIFRMIAAYLVYGPQALDDYFHGIMPASRFYEITQHNLPDYRSPLLVWMMGGWLKIVGVIFGPLSPLAQVRGMLVFLG